MLRYIKLFKQSFLKTKMGIERFFRNAFFLGSIIGASYLSGCKEVEEATPVTNNQRPPRTIIKSSETKTGAISGQVLWKPIWSDSIQGSPYALVTFGYKWTIDGPPNGWFSCGEDKYCTIADSSGNFYLDKILEGTHDLYIVNMTGSTKESMFDAIDAIYSRDFKGLDIKGDSTINMGEVILDETNELHRVEKTSPPIIHRN